MDNWRNNRHHIKCCKDCKPPKRYPGCGAHCQEYKDEKAELKRLQEAYKTSAPPVISQYDFNRVRSCASRKRGK